MKTLKRWFSRRGALPLTCYLVAVVLWLVLGAVHWGSDALARSSGAMYEAVFGSAKSAKMTPPTALVS